MAQIGPIPCLTHSGPCITIHNGLLHESLNDCWASLGMVIGFMCMYITDKHLPILRSGVLSMESTKSMQDFPSVLEVLKEFCFLKGASTISLNFGGVLFSLKYGNILLNAHVHCRPLFSIKCSYTLYIEAIYKII